MGRTGESADVGDYSGFLNLIARAIAKNILNDLEGPSLAQETQLGSLLSPGVSLEQGEGKLGAVEGIDVPRPSPPETGHPARDA